MSRAEEVAAQFDALKAQTSDLPTRDLEPTCRCGRKDDSPLGVKPREVDPPVDLRSEDFDIDLTTNTWHRSIECRSCHHLIYPGTRCIVLHVPHEHDWRLPHYHPECAVIS